jgi:quercetin dioxygenase-like cupin family protein
MHNQTYNPTDTFNDDPALSESDHVDIALVADNTATSNELPPEQRVLKTLTEGHDMDVHALNIPKGKKLQLKSATRERVVVVSQGTVAVLIDGDSSKGFKAVAPAHFILPKGVPVDIITLDDVICYGIGQHYQKIVPLDEEASEIEHFFTEGVYARKMVIPKGTKVPTHKHAYNHLSILAQGRVRVAVGVVIQEYIAPAMIEIEKDITHTILALEDSVWFCIHATDAKDIESLEQTVILKD